MRCESEKMVNYEYSAAFDWDINKLIYIAKIEQIIIQQHKMDSLLSPNVPKIKFNQNRRSLDKNNKNKPSLLNAKALSPSNKLNQRWTKSKSKSKKPSKLFSEAHVIDDKQSYIERYKSENRFEQGKLSDENKNIGRYRSLMMSQEISIKIVNPMEQQNLSSIINKFAYLDLPKIQISHIEKNNSRQNGERSIDGDQQLLKFIK